MQKKYGGFFIFERGCLRNMDRIPWENFVSNFGVRRKALNPRDSIFRRKTEAE